MIDVVLCQMTGADVVDFRTIGVDADDFRTIDDVAAMFDAADRTPDLRVTDVGFRRIDAVVLDCQAIDAYVADSCRRGFDDDPYFREVADVRPFLPATDVDPFHRGPVEVGPFHRGLDVNPFHRGIGVDSFRRLSDVDPSDGFLHPSVGSFHLHRRFGSDAFGVRFRLSFRLATVCC